MEPFFKVVNIQRMGYLGRIAIWMLFSPLIHSQSKGLAALGSGGFPSRTSVTRAVVVGISNYQSPKIPDLQYADKDAIAFANWLKQTCGNLHEDQIRMLTNEQATTAQFDAALGWLLEESEEGDRAIIYFSGHGDTETKTMYNRGFLLCYDSPPNNYAAGAYALVFLQDNISTLSVKKKVQVLVIADACRSGTLAGSIIEGSTVSGAQLTASEMSRLFAKETKILSCQPDEFSIEGKQWGGGRGVFSYYLLEGLLGLADLNHDNVINLMELGSYIQEKISYDISPYRQTPMIIGRLNDTLATVRRNLLTEYIHKKSIEPLALSPVVNKGQEEILLSKVDTIIKDRYRRFYMMIEAGRFFDQTNQCADSIFRSISHIESLAPLLPAMRRNFAAALQDEVQQSLNALLLSDPNEINRWKHFPDRYETYPLYLQRALELLGANHRLHNTLKAKKIFFEAYLMKKRIFEPEQDLVKKNIFRDKIKEKLLEAHELDPGAAYICYEIGSLYYFSFPQKTDSLLKWNQMAIERSPSWLLPYIDISAEYQIQYSDQFGNAEKWLLKALAKDSNSIVTNERLAWLYQRLNKTDLTIALCNKIISLNPGIPNGYYTLSGTYAFRREFDKMKYYFEKVQQMNVQEFHVEPYFIRNRNSSYFTEVFERRLLLASLPVEVRFMYLANLAISYYTIGQSERALEYVRKCDSSITYPWYYMDVRIINGRILLDNGKLLEADSVFRSVRQFDSTMAHYCKSFAWQGVVAEALGNYSEAESLFRKAIQSWVGSSWDDFMPQEECHFLYGMFLVRQKRFEEAEKLFNRANELSFQNGYMGWFGLACLSAVKKNEERALLYLKNAIDRGFPLRKDVENEQLLSCLKNNKKFKRMLDQAFLLAK